VQLFEHERILVCHERTAGLRAVIAVHNTVLGPGLGGIRMWPFGSDEEALVDVLRLSRGMTYKNSLAGLPLGGGKTVVIGDSRTDKTPAMFRALGRAIDSLDGLYLAAEDVGTTTADATEVARETRFITGLPQAVGGSGDPSPMTAWGVFVGMRAALREAGLDPSFEGVSVVVQGAGHVGAALTGHLLAAGAAVTVADIHPDRVEPLRAAGAAVADPTDVHTLACDVFSPCALGAVVRPETIEGFRCRVIAGAANNQLLDGSMGDALASRGVVYAPDFAVNAGGVINIGEELGQPYDPGRALVAVGRIEQTLEAVFALAHAEGIPPHRAAEQLAERRISERQAEADEPTP
jgi:leucine dehydrogenase